MVIAVTVVVIPAIVAIVEVLVTAILAVTAVVADLVLAAAAAAVIVINEGWNFNSGNYLLTTDTK